jgi:thymidylate synthase
MKMKTYKLAYPSYYVTEADTFDGLWSRAMGKVMMDGMVTRPRGMEVKEVLAHTLVLENPKNRYIFNPERKMSPFYMVGELLWYLSGKNDLDFISYYGKAWNDLSDDGKTLNSAYGYRIFTPSHKKIGFNQWDHVKKQLMMDRHTRQAIIHLHTPNDQSTKDEVCTLCLQFFIRNDRLDLHVTMRSNDAVWGTTYDIYAFTTLQETMAMEMGVELGKYYHTAGSLHIYEKNYEMVDRALKLDEIVVDCDEICVPEDFRSEVPILLVTEDLFRNGTAPRGPWDMYQFLSKYSRNLYYMLALYHCIKKKDPERFLKEYEKFKDDMYLAYNELLKHYVENKTLEVNG